MSVKEQLINTGNILSLNEIKKKVGLNPSDELKESLKIVFSQKDQDEGIITDIDDKIIPDNVDRKDLKITIKVFVSHLHATSLKDVLNKAFNVLQTDKIESLILAYNEIESTDEKLSGLQSLWTVVEEFVDAGKLCSVGVSDIDTAMFIKLFHWAKVKPNIIQINLDACCVVPPALQEFAKENDVQLLTHNDPLQILSKEDASKLFEGDVNVKWVIRYQVHLKCRGVLSTKGYLLCINRL